MDVLKWLILLLVSTPLAISRAISDIKFLQDFLRNASSRVLLNTCWNRRITKTFLEDSRSNLHIAIQRFPIYGGHHNIKYFDRNLVIIDIRNCTEAMLYLNKINEQNLFTKPVKYLVMVSPFEYDTLVNNIRTYSILPNTDFIIAIFSGGVVNMLQPYKVGKFDLITWEEYGNWSIKHGLQEFYRGVSISRRRRDLKGVNLVAGIVVLADNSTWKHLTDFRAPDVDTFTKQDFGTVKCVFEYLNINYSLVSEHSYGYYDEVTKQMSGFVGRLYGGEIDVSAVSVYMTEERYKVIDFISMGNNLLHKFVMKKPSTSYVKNIFLLTFTRKVWCSIMLVSAIFAFSLYIVLNWETKYRQPLTQNRYSASDVVLISLEAIAQQGTNTDSKSFSGRIMILTLFTAFMFLYVSYSANIVVLLQSTTKLANLKELLESRVDVGAWQIHYMKTYFENADDDILRSIYKRKIYPNNNYYTREDGLRKMQEGNFAFFTTLQAAYHYILHKFTNYEVCALQELLGFMKQTKGHFPIQRNSPYKELFKIGLFKTSEFGIMKRTDMRVIRKPRCHSQGAIFKSVGIFDCYQVILLWIGGVLISLVILLIENLVHAISHNKTALIKSIKKVALGLCNFNFRVKEA